MTIAKIESAYDAIYKELFTIHGEPGYYETTQAIIDLCNLIKETETDELLWSIGEGDECGLDGLIIGAYWHYCHYHGGQNSIGYLAQCVIGEIYSPGMECEPTDDECGQYAFECLNRLAECSL